MNKILKYIGKLRNIYVGEYALVANTVTAGVLGFTGDILAQKTEQGLNSKFKWDKSRSTNMAIVCTTAGPLMHYWYKFLDYRFPGKVLKSVAIKVCLDVLSGPIWYTWYIGGLSFLKGHNFQQFKQDFKDKVPVIVVVDLTLWPIFQTFNFAFFPPHYRVLVLKSNELILDVIYSHIANNSYTLKSIYSNIFKK